MRGLSSELLKYRRTMTEKLLVLLPLFFVLQALPSLWLMPAGVVRKWENVTSMVFNLWTVAFLPFGIALLAYLVDLQEKRAGNYRGLRVRAYAPWRLWIDKVLVMSIFLLVTSMVLLIATIFSGLITVTEGKWAIPWSKILLAVFFSWFTSLALIPLQLWIAAWKGMFAGMGMGFAGMVSGIALAAKPFWYLSPWAWSIRMMCPILQLNPNGVMMDASDVLQDSSVLSPGLLLSLGASFVVAGISAFCFQRRDCQ